MLKGTFRDKPFSQHIRSQEEKRREDLASIGSTFFSNVRVRVQVGPPIFLFI